MQSAAKTIDEYLDSLSPERRETLNRVRETVLANLPKEYEERMNWGMITWQVPLETFSDTYNGKPLMYAALASQKNYCSLYLSAIYMAESTKAEFEELYRASGKRYDVGKSCVRFKTIDDLPLDLIGRSIASVPVEDFVELYKRTHPANS